MLPSDPHCRRWTTRCCLGWLGRADRRWSHSPPGPIRTCPSPSSTARWRSADRTRCSSWRWKGRRPSARRLSTSRDPVASHVERGAERVGEQPASRDRLIMVETADTADPSDTAEIPSHAGRGGSATGHRAVRGGSRSDARRSLGRKSRSISGILPSSGNRVMKWVPARHTDDGTAGVSRWSGEGVAPTGFVFGGAARFRPSAWFRGGDHSEGRNLPTAPRRSPRRGSRGRARSGLFRPDLAHARVPTRRPPRRLAD